MIFPPDLPPEQLRPVALAAEESGVAEFWLWEDCFKESGIATAAAMLAWTQHLGVGIGLLPAPLRNVGLTAMELAKLARLFPGRIRPGIGHGVQEWMGQVGARAQSPMTLLQEYVTALRGLLHGQTMSTAGRYVQLDDITLDWPPEIVPPLLVGGVGPRTLELAGRLGDGAILTEGTTADQLRDAVAHVHTGHAASDHDSAPEVVVFLSVTDRPSAEEVAHRVDELVGAGATTVVLHSVGAAKPLLADFIHLVGRDVQSLIR